jgi:hypothetical protein
VTAWKAAWAVADGRGWRGIVVGRRQLGRRLADGVLEGGGMGDGWPMT